MTLTFKFLALLPLCYLLISLTNADPIPHSAHSKLYILSRLAFNYLDLSMDGKLTEGEMDALRTFPLNGMTLRSKEEVKRLREAMDGNKNGLVDEDEFIKFEKWLPTFINGRPNSVVYVRELMKYAKGRDMPEYAHLDRNHDGQLDQKELTTVI